MKAFKAANPGAVFQDFVNWYGNPENPLDEYNNSMDDSCISHHEGQGLISAETIASNQHDAFFILMETRDFWSSAWDEAQPLPASEQKPLFDAHKTVEMAIDDLENIHPAILLNQVMAVNLASAYFMLASSAKDTINIELVNLKFRRLRKEIERALELLSDEAAEATCSISARTGAPRSMSDKFVSPELISLCESACTALSEVEIIVSLATTLLTKFPAQYELVQSILMRPDGETIELRNVDARKSILNIIQDQQVKYSVPGSHPSDQFISTKPVLREFIFRNIDDSQPCQLSVRCGDEEAMLDKNCSGGGLIVALSKSLND